MKEIIAFIVCWPLAFLLIKHREYIKGLVGNIGFAEKVFGSGGTYTFLLILAIFLWLFPILHTFGVFDSLTGASFGRFIQ
jgi:hypothetical protein